MRSNARWPMQLLGVGDSFQVDDPRDFNSAKSRTSQYKAQHPDTIFTQRISCGRCKVTMTSGRKRCRCASGKPRKILTIRRWR